MTKKKGFTLVELLVVIAILAILATVSIVGYTSFIQKANDSNALTETKQTYDLVYADLIGVVGKQQSEAKISVAAGSGIIWVENTDSTLVVGTTYAKTSTGGDSKKATTADENYDVLYTKKGSQATVDEEHYTTITPTYNEKADGSSYYADDEDTTGTKLENTDSLTSGLIYTYKQSTGSKSVVFTYSADGTVAFTADSNIEYVDVSALVPGVASGTKGLDITAGMKAAFKDLELKGKFYLMEAGTIIYVTENGKGSCTWTTNEQVGTN